MVSRVSDGFWEPWHLLGFNQVSAAVYQQILDCFMRPVERLYEDADFIFQQALAPFCVFVMIF